MSESESKATFDPGQVRIAGKKTVRDWQLFRTTLIPGGDPATWRESFRSYFYPRLATRYIKPIECLQKKNALAGEGFSILAIHCTLIEFLEATIQGKSYRFRRRNDPPHTPFEYSDSGKLFANFLAKRDPFSAHFDDGLATDFYRSVRCGLLHEARTKSNWIIKANGPSGVIVSVRDDHKIVFRDNFHTAVLSFIDSFKNTLMKETAVQEAFIRKFDSLCQ